MKVVFLKQYFFLLVIHDSMIWILTYLQSLWLFLRGNYKTPVNVVHSILQEDKVF